MESAPNPNTGARSGVSAPTRRPGGGAAISTRLMASLLYGVSPMNPLTFGSVALALCGVALLASWIPARRAAGVDPVEALRAEG